MTLASGSLTLGICLFIWCSSLAIAEMGPPGVLQLQIEGFFNRHGRDAAGRCCVLPANSTAAVPSCPSQCRTFFRVCAARVGPNWPDEPDLRQHTLACPLGLLVTPNIARNSLDPTNDGILLMRFPYKEWPGKLKLTIEAWHDVSGELFTYGAQDVTRHDNLEESVARLILRIERRHRLVLGEDWLRRSVHISVPKGDNSRRTGRRISLTYALRIINPPPVTTTTTTTTTTTPEPEPEPEPIPIIPYPAYPQPEPIPIFIYPNYLQGKSNATATGTTYFEEITESPIVTEISIKENVTETSTKEETVITTPLMTSSISDVTVNEETVTTEQPITETVMSETTTEELTLGTVTTETDDETPTPSDLESTEEPDVWSDEDVEPALPDNLSFSEIISSILQSSDISDQTLQLGNDTSLQSPDASENVISSTSVNETNVSEPVIRSSKHKIKNNT